MGLIDSLSEIKELVTLQAEIKDMLDNEMQLFLEPAPESIREVLKYYYSQGGKRLRPALMLSVAKAFNSDENLAPFALTIELIHTMSLIHDDVIDQAKERRGAPTMHEKWDSATAIVGGDIFHAVIHGHILSAIQTNRIKNKDTAIRFLVDLIQIAELKVGAAVIEEMRFAEASQIPNLEDSIEVTAGKTAPLFAFCSAAGAYLANQDAEIVNDMFEMGWKLGYAFQLLDDLLDYFKSDKDSGGDLREDKKTPLLVLAHIKNPGLLDEFRKRKLDLSFDDIKRFRGVFKDQITEVLNWVDNEIKASKQFLSKIPENSDKQLIKSFFALFEARAKEIGKAILMP